MIEVSDSSLRFDRESKALLYAEAGIPEYWIVNLVNDVLEVFRNPEEGVYQTHDVLKATERVAPLSFHDLELTVRELLPQPSFFHALERTAPVGCQWRLQRVNEPGRVKNIGNH